MLPQLGSHQSAVRCPEYTADSPAQAPAGYHPWLSHFVLPD